MTPDPMLVILPSDVLKAVTQITGIGKAALESGRSRRARNAYQLLCRTMRHLGFSVADIERMIGRYSTNPVDQASIDHTVEVAAVYATQRRARWQHPTARIPRWWLHECITAFLEEQHPYRDNPEEFVNQWLKQRSS